MIVYRMELTKPPAEPALPGGGHFVFLASGGAIRRPLRAFRQAFGLFGTLKLLLKILSRKRIFFGVIEDQRVVQYGWASIGFCRYYSVPSDAIVLGDLWTAEDRRGRGLSTAALETAMAQLYRRGYRAYYIDALENNRASLRMIQKAGFVKTVTAGSNDYPPV